MVAASRMGGSYDGFVAGDPGFDLPRAAIQHAWDAQSFLSVDPDIKKSFSVKDMALIASKVVEVCDGLDGVKDGMVGDIRACQKAFHLADLQCKGAKDDTCLSETQVKALTRAFAGPTNSKGEALYSDWSFDAGMGAHDWRFWKIESGIPPWDGNPLIATMGAASLSEIFTTPPTPTRGDPALAPRLPRPFRFRPRRAENLRQGDIRGRRQAYRLSGVGVGVHDPARRRQSEA